MSKLYKIRSKRRGGSKLQEQQKRSPFYKNLMFWFLIVLIGCFVLGLVIGEDIPDWLEFIRRLLR
jgi:hypothetical protein